MNQVGQFGDYQIDALQWRLLQLGHLLFDDGFERDIGREKTASNTVCILDCKCDFSSQIFFIEFYLFKLEEKKMFKWLPAVITKTLLWVTLTNSNGNLSLKMRFIFAPPDNSFVFTSLESAPVIAFSKSFEMSWSILP